MSGTEGQTQQGELLYLGISDDPADTEVEARLSLYAFAPAVRGTQVIVDAQADEMEADGFWEGRVTYGSPSYNLAAGDTRQSFTTAGGTQHVTVAKEHIATYSVDSIDPITTKFDGVIGPDEDGGASGTDVDLPIWEERRTYVFTDEEMTTTFKGILFALTAHTNDDDFLYFNEGECKYRGVDGGQRPDGQWEVTFILAGSPNATNLHVPTGLGDIIVAAKKGWDVLSVKYKRVEDTDNVSIGTIIEFVFIDRVYDPADFTLFGIT